MTDNKELRGRGYGTKGLALALELARNIVPEEEIYLRVLKSNIPSFKAYSWLKGFHLRQHYPTQLLQEQRLRMHSMS